MRREIFFLIDPKRNVQYRQDEIKNLEKAFDASSNLVSAQKQLFQAHLFHAIALYSYGADKNEVKKTFLPTLTYLDNFFVLNALADYNILLWFASLCKVFDSKEGLQKLHITNPELQGQDAIADFIIFGKTTTSSLLHPKTYHYLHQAIQTEGNTAVEHIQNYLKTYYPSVTSLPWHDKHMEHEAEFFGYWLFELPIVVSHKQLDDMEFANHMFYPRDLMDGKAFFMTYEEGEEGDKLREVFEKEKKKAEIKTQQLEEADKTQLWFQSYKKSLKEDLGYKPTIMSWKKFRDIIKTELKENLLGKMIEIPSVQIVEDGEKSENVVKRKFKPIEDKDLDNLVEEIVKDFEESKTLIDFKRFKKNIKAFVARF